MHQKELLKDTIQFLDISERKKRGIKFHEQYALSIYRILLILFIGLLIHWYLFDYRFALFFGGLILLGSISIEIILKLFYGFSGRDAVKYYALQMYQNPSKKNMDQLKSWNKNPFDLTTEYYYPRIGELVNTASTKNNPVNYINTHIPDALRLIERRERDDYQVLVDLDSMEEYNLDSYYENLLQESNYTYKFGAYTSVSMLLRKLTENLIEDILFAKGLYAELPHEPTFQDMTEIFIEEVIRTEYEPEIADDLETSLDEWIRKKGNKGAHIPEEFTQDEIETLMNHAQKTVRLLIVIRSELDIRTDDISQRKID